MQTTSISVLFNGGVFGIPEYQRDYSWNIEQMKDLVGDIEESIVADINHYLGTVVVSQGLPHDSIVDGQQRLTSLMLLIKALLQRLPVSDEMTIYLRYQLLVSINDGGLKIRPRNLNFINSMFNGENREPQDSSERNLRNAYNYCVQHAQMLMGNGADYARIREMLTAIGNLEVIVFRTGSVGQAIRIFQTVNDRGLPLSVIDKTKALLVYYSNHFLEGRLDQEVCNRFGRVFRAFDSIKRLSSMPGCEIKNINRITFSEDELLRYHYMAYNHSLAVNIDGYDISAVTVLGWLRNNLENNKHDLERLQDFIEDYTTDFVGFVQSFQDLVAKATDSGSGSARLYKLFVILGLSAFLYPITIRLNQRHLLNHPLDGVGRDLLYYIEVCDVRVYKIRGTGPASHVGHASHQSRFEGANTIATLLREFVLLFMGNDQLKNKLNQSMYGNAGTVHILLARSEKIRGAEYSINELMEFVNSGITLEHIIPQSPPANIGGYGFGLQEDFLYHIDLLGNLTLLTAQQNAALGNMDIGEKMANYSNSCYHVTQQIHHEFMPMAEFNRTALLNRHEAMKKFVVKNWSV